MNYILYNPKANNENNDLNVIPGTAELEKLGAGEGGVQYKMKDWAFNATRIPYASMLAAETEPYTISPTMPTRWIFLARSSLSAPVLATIFTTI